MNRAQNSTHALAVAADGISLLVLWLALTGLRASLRDVWTLDLIPGEEPILEAVSFPLHAWLGLVMAPVWLWALSWLRTYDDLRVPPSRWRLLQSATLALLVSLGLFFAAHITDFLSRSLVFGFALASIPTLRASRHLLAMLLRQRIVSPDPWQVVVLGDARSAERLAHRLHGNVLGLVTLAPGAVAGLPVLGSIHELEHILIAHPIDQVLLAGREWGAQTLQRVASCCEEVGVPFSIDASFLRLDLSRAELEAHNDAELISFWPTRGGVVTLTLKRGIDLLGAAALLVVLSPLLLATAAAIRLTDGGPVLFRQERVGRYGRRFTMYKFRSMVPDAEQRQSALAHLNEMSGPAFKLAADPRITTVGRWLRRSSIDELPQLWNVLRGEMSLVGPRPPLPGEVARYLRWQRRRLSMKPGLTCIWQVSGRNHLDFDTWIRLDLEYIDNWSLGLDLKLLMRTIPVVLTGYGAR